MTRIIVLIALVAPVFAEMTSAPAPTAPGPGAPAPGAEGGQTAGGGGEFIFIIMIAFLALMVFTSFRSQKKEQKKHRALIDALKIGDQVESIGGIVGVVERRGEKDVDVRTGGSDGSLLTFNLAAIKGVIVDDADVKKE